MTNKVRISLGFQKYNDQQLATIAATVLGGTPATAAKNNKGEAVIICFNVTTRLFAFRTDSARLVNSAASRKTCLASRAWGLRHANLE